MHENRETSETPAVKPGGWSAGEGDSRTARADVSEESHSGILPMNHSNNDKTSSAESREGRPLIKENAGQPNTYPTQSGKGVSQGLAGVRKAARENKEMKFNRPAPPSDRRSAAGKLLLVEEESRTRSGRGYLARV
jgi:RNA-directed DNA polymerase